MHKSPTSVACCNQIHYCQRRFGLPHEKSDVQRAASGAQSELCGVALTDATRSDIEHPVFLRYYKMGASISDIPLLKAPFFNRERPLRSIYEWNRHSFRAVQPSGISRSENILKGRQEKMQKALDKAGKNVYNIRNLRENATGISQEYLEKYSRGRRGAPAKGVGRLYRRESSNLSFSASGKLPLPTVGECTAKYHASFPDV